MKILWVLFIGVLSLGAAAQVAPKCEDSFKVFEGRYFTKEYNDAYSLLADLRKRCPKVNENLYNYGETVLKYKIEVATLPEEKKTFIEDLVALYNEQAINYPSSGADVKKIQLQLDNKLITNAGAYKAFNAAFARNRQSFTDYNALLSYYNLFLEEYKAGKGISDDQYFEKYGEITSQVIFAQDKISKERDALVKKQETNMLTDQDRQFIADAEPNIDGLESVSEVIASQSKEYVTCDKMNAYYDKTFDSRKTDYIWVESMVTALYSKKCFKSAVLKKGAVILHEKKPAKESAYRLGVIALKNGDAKEGVKYFEQAADLETDQVKKAKLYFEIATAAQNSDKALSKKYILKTVEANPKMGQPYLLLAEMYANVSPKSDCKFTDFDRKVLNFLAIDTAKKAEVEPKYKKASDDAIAKYKKKLPTKEEAKVLGKKKGDSITFGCWINETVTLPNL
jgi:hypothetical protein